MDGPTIFHDGDPGDAFAWQSIGTLAATLGIAERTVRARVAAGSAERCTGPGGRSFYRLAPEGGSHGTPEGRQPAEGDEEVRRQVLALVGDLTERYSATVAELHRERQAAAVEAAEARLLAEVAVRDVERARLEAEALAGELARERARRELVERLASLPWYAVSRRRRLVAELEALARPALPAAARA